MAIPQIPMATEHANLTREYRVPLDDENDAEIRFFGSEFGIRQIEALSDFVDFIKKQLERKAKAQSES